MPYATSATVVAGPGERAKMLTAEQVAGVVAGIPATGEACDALKKVGWRASIAGEQDQRQRRSVRPVAGVGAPGGIDARWVIYKIVGKPPVWVGMGCWSGAQAVTPRARGPFVHGGTAPSEHTGGNCRD